MHDVISKTLPHQTPTGLEEIARLSALWGQDAMNGAAKAVGMAEGELWSWARLKQVDDHLQTLAATKQDSAMLERDEPKAAPASRISDARFDGVRQAVEALVVFVTEDAHNAADDTGIDDRTEAIVDEVKRLLRVELTFFVDSIYPPKPSADNGLLTSHNPDKRGVM